MSEGVPPAGPGGAGAGVQGEADRLSLHECAAPSVEVGYERLRVVEFLLREGDRYCATDALLAGALYYAAKLIAAGEHRR